MRAPHKHTDIIKAWADGYTIQFFDEVVGQWRNVSTRVCPWWDPEISYRVLEHCEGYKNDQDL